MEQLSNLYSHWMAGDGSLVERIAGLLILFYGFTNEELRQLLREDFSNGVLNHRDQEIELHPRLNEYVEEYINWRETYYFGLNDSNKYFFISKISVFWDRPVYQGHFAKLFKRNGLPAPSDLRKSMIFFHKDQLGFDPFALAIAFGISPRGAARYWE